jgi:hypothetical protein
MKKVEAEEENERKFRQVELAMKLQFEGESSSESSSTEPKPENLAANSSSDLPSSDYPQQTNLGLTEMLLLKAGEEGMDDEEDEEEDVDEEEDDEEEVDPEPEPEPAKKDLPPASEPLSCTEMLEKVFSENCDKVDMFSPQGSDDFCGQNDEPLRTGAASAGTSPRGGAGVAVGPVSVAREDPAPKPASPPAKRKVRWLAYC